LDFHFRTNQRLIDAARRGVSRSWYMDELEWIRFREVDDGDEAPEHNGDAHNNNNNNAIPDNSAQAAEKEHAKKLARWVKASADGPSASNVCPICQDNFDTVWHEEAQEWVWLDAVQVGSRVFHASCREEIAKDDRSALARATPEPSVLGKRKAEDEGGSRLKRELLR